MSPLARWFLIGGSIALFAGPGLGILGTTLSMSHAFALLGESGVAEPRALAEEIGGVLIYPLAGFSIGILGALSIILGVITWLAERRKTPPALPAA